MNVNIDPKISVINTRLAKIQNIIAVSGIKGGVGKSTAACTLALQLAKAGQKVGLLDLDFNGASCAQILGLKDEFPQEIEGLVPPVIAGVKFMTTAFFTQDKAVNFRGTQITSALLEILAVTQWGCLDFLIIDMPPGFGDMALDIIKFVPRAQVLFITTPSILSQNLVQKSGQLLHSLNIAVLGKVLNMAPSAIAYDSALEATYGNPQALLGTDFAADFATQIAPLLAKLK